MKPFEQEGTEKTAAAAKEWIEQPRNKVTKPAQLGCLVTLLFKTSWRLRPAGGTRGAARNYFTFSTTSILIGLRLGQVLGQILFVALKLLYLGRIFFGCQNPADFSGFSDRIFNVV